MKRVLITLAAFASLVATATLRAVGSVSTPPDELLRTDRWGYVWKRPYSGTNNIVRYLPNKIATTNTPGNVLNLTHGSARITHPTYYAFLDGFDTRAIAVVASNAPAYEADPRTAAQSEYDTDPWGVTHTNLGYRQTFFNDFAKRSTDLYALKCGTNAPNAFWSSSFIDAATTNAMEDLQPFESFGWTTNVAEKFFSPDGFGDGYTRWWPTFNSMHYYPASSAFAPTNAFELMPYGATYKKKAEREPLFKAFEKVSFKDPVSGKFFYDREDYRTPSVVPFDNVLLSVYPKATNLTSFANASARNIHKQIAQANQAISLFDRTVHVDDMPVVYTNAVSYHGHVSVTGAVQLATQRITIEANGDGTYSCQELEDAPRFYATRAPTLTQSLEITNFHCSAKSPRLRSLSPGLQSGIVGEFDPQASGYTYLLDTSRPEFQSTISDFISDFCESTGYDWETIGIFPVYFTCSADAVSGRASISIWNDRHEWYGEPISFSGGNTLNMYGQFAATNGSYDVTWQALLSTSYYANTTTLPRLISNAVLYPSCTSFVSGYRNAFLMSYADVRGDRAWDSAIDFDFGDSLSWDYNLGYGYRCYIGETSIYQHHYDVEFLTALIYAEMKTGVGAAANPREYTGLGIDDFYSFITNRVTDYTIQGSTSCPDYSSMRFMLANEDDMWKVYEARWEPGMLDPEPIGDPITDLHIFTYQLDIGVTIPANGVTLTNLAHAVDTKIQSVTEVDWAFPQLTTSPTPINN